MHRQTVCARPTGTLRLALVAALLIAVVCVGCDGRNQYAPPPPPEVVVATAEQRPVTIYHQYTGTTQASEVVQLRARVSGYLDSVHFQEGANVTKGQLLFVIDQRPYKAQLEQARADLEGKQATVVQQESIYKRSLELVPYKAVAQSEVDVNRGNWLVAKAAVLQSEAAFRQAQLNLEYTEIRAPTDGRISRQLVDPGNLVTPDTTLLTTLYAYNPMYAYFTASEANYLAYLKRQRAKARARAAQSAAALPRQPKPQAAASATSQTKPAPGNPPSTATPERERTPMELGLANETGYPHQGFIDFAEPTVDPNTGTLLIRGVFPNPEPYRLAPGLFVRLRIPITVDPKALLVPEAALGSDQAGRYLLVVRPDNTVEHRSVTVGSQVDSMRVIEHGLQPGERFVVEGLQRARPGETVRPITRKPPAS
jgi:RND family efflux transporter MFP subunit